MSARAANSRRMRTLGYRLFDADTHYYEPDDCFTRHIEARFSPQTHLRLPAAGTAGRSRMTALLP